VTTSPRPESIITGKRRDERIKKALLAGANFDEKYKMPTRAEQVTTWDAYLNHACAGDLSYAGTGWITEASRSRTDVSHRREGSSTQS
jgi:hypothetical protein